MSRLNRRIDNVNTIEDIIDLVYAAALRLTGDSPKGEVLARKALKAAVKQDNTPNVRTALQCLCAVFKKESAGKPVLKHSGQNCSSCNNYTFDVQGIQKALLCLGPGERLVLILREMWGLSYAEISFITGMNEKEVSKTLASGRWSLRNCFDL
ncbi:MAG: hypothetical protein K9L17_00730 [Clostridiales bacterium]|nr:hypothetical protein [Clostridiales bacterium]MCF8021217.1 hypothetical protein [Clostridiales bacterium]